jgi:predicted GIY-YIG superfamily endonuclease
MNSIHQGLTVVQRWLLKLIEADKEREEDRKRSEEKERAKRREAAKERRLRPKPKPPVVVEKKVKAVVRVSEPIKGEGFVYLMRSGNGYHKIGISKNMRNRLDGLKRQFPIQIDVVHKIASRDYRKAERFLHDKYRAKRAENEWFSLAPQDIQWIMSLRDYDLDKMA